MTSITELRTAVGLEIVLRDEAEAMTLFEFAARLDHLGVLLDVVSKQPSNYLKMLSSDRERFEERFRSDRRGVNQHLRPFRATVRSISYNSPPTLVIDLTPTVAALASVGFAGVIAGARSVLKLVDKVTDTIEKVAAGRANVAESTVRRLKTELIVKEFIDANAKSALGRELNSAESANLYEATKGLVFPSAEALVDIERIEILEN